MREDCHLLALTPLVCCGDTAYMSSPCHIELILSEKEAPVKKEVKSLPSKSGGGSSVMCKPVTRNDVKSVCLMSCTSLICRLKRLLHRSHTGKTKHACEVEPLLPQLSFSGLHGHNIHVLLDTSIQ